MKTKEEVIEEFRVQSIREAATRVIARKGLAGASMQEIADEAQVAKGTLYLYFRNQQELLAAAIDQALIELLGTLEQALESDGNFEDRLRMLIRRQLEFFASNHDLFQIHLSTKYADGVAQGSSRCERVSSSQYQVYIGRLKDFLAGAMERGEIRTMDPGRLAVFIQEGMAGVLFQRMSDGASAPVEDEVEWISKMIVSGVAVAKRSRRKN